MTTVKAVGAVSSEAAEWYAIDWPAIHRNVRRLQRSELFAKNCGTEAESTSTRHLSP